MKPEPMKDKLPYGDMEDSEQWLKIEDIKSAIKWFKKQIDKETDTSEDGGYGFEWVSPTKVEELIDEAFEDVCSHTQKKENK